MRKRDMAGEVRRFMDVYNEAWGDNWGFVPITDAEVEFQAKNLKQVIDENWAYMAEKDGEVVGAALTLPDINQVMAKLNGRLLPFGWAQFLLGKRKIDQCASSRSGSSTTTATPASPPASTSGTSRRRRSRAAIVGGEMGWILETNEPMNRAMEGMGGKVVKRYRLYERLCRELGRVASANCGACEHRIRSRSRGSVNVRSLR